MRMDTEIEYMQREKNIMRLFEFCHLNRAYENDENARMFWRTTLHPYVCASPAFYNLYRSYHANYLEFADNGRAVGEPHRINTSAAGVFVIQFLCFLGLHVTMHVLLYV